MWKQLLNEAGIRVEGIPGQMLSKRIVDGNGIPGWHGICARNLRRSTGSILWVRDVGGIGFGIAICPCSCHWRTRTRDERRCPHAFDLLGHI